MKVENRMNVWTRVMAALSVAAAAGCRAEPFSTWSEAKSDTQASTSEQGVESHDQLAAALSAKRDEQRKSDADSSAAEDGAVGTDGAKQGMIVDGPRSVRDFSPADLATKIDGHEIDFRDALEDLGPAGIQWYQHVLTLSDPWFEGRAPGTDGIERAQDYLEYWMKRAGLEPAFPGPDGGEGHGDGETEWTSYFQKFDFPSPNPKVKVNSQELMVGSEAFKADEDYRVAGVSASAEVIAPLVFVGYAIEDGQEGYSSFEEGADLSGRIAVVLRYEPLNDDGKSRWSETRFSRFANIRPKLEAVVKRGAAGVIVVNPPGAADGKKELDETSATARWGSRASIPIVQMSPEAGGRLIALAGEAGASLMDWRKKADNGDVKTMHLRDDVKVKISTNLDVDDRLHTENVGGVLRGKGALADQWVIIGAHYDHIGHGYTGAMPQNVGSLHPGADDNASGTAAILISAEELREKYKDAGDGQSLRSVLFLCFSAEEAGLFGSKFFVDNPTFSSANTQLMINMDMIGRLRSNNLYVGGVGTAAEMEGLLMPLVEKSGLTISKGMGGMGPSDHASFFRWGVPVLFFFTGEHADYHRPTDEGYTVNPAGAVKIMDLLVNTVWEASSMPNKLTFVERQGGGDGRPSRARARLGIQPAYQADLESGILVDGVSEASAAEKAGIKAGDILLTWNGEELNGPRSLMDKLAESEPGASVRIKLMRGTDELDLMVTLQGPNNAE